ncbi:hypothetical protein A9Q76_06260 [Arcobacter sp. 31_11_sub10_T18]|nr:hypothetical protein A9Q76_06260 [Arcobacter sp. 31_11_sub10_T18]
MNFLRRRFHTLQDIRKILIYVPPIFVLVMAVLAIFLSSLILEKDQKNRIDLLIQEEQFIKKKLLNEFINDSQDQASAIFDEVERELNHRVYEVSGFIKSLTLGDKKLSFEQIKPFIKKIENDKDIQFVFFNSKTFEVIYGKSIVRYLQTLTDSNVPSDSFRIHILRNIQFLGNGNLQYWLDKNKRNIRLSYFEEIKELGWYFGAFSNVDDMSILLKKSIIKSLSAKSKGLDNHFWFYDYKTDLVYNYHNFGKVDTYENVMEMFNTDESKRILKYYHDQRRNNITLTNKVFNFPEYQYLVAIKESSVRMPNNIKEKIAKIKIASLNRFTTVVISIIFIAIFLGIATVAFSKYINLILAHYNRRLEVKNKLQVHWKERYELAIIASNDGLWDINFEKDVIYFSDKWLEMFGYKKGDITTFAQWLNLIHDSDKVKVQESFDKHLEGKSENFVVEYRLKNSQNIYKWVLVRGRVFKDKNGKPQRMLMMSMDIEERKQLTKELQDVELLVEYGRIVIFKWKNNKSLDVVHVSKSISAYGYTKEDFENKKIKYLDFIHRADTRNLALEITNAIKQNKNSFTKIYRVYGKNGKKRWIFHRAIFIKDHFGKVTHLYGYINDITNMKMTEEELKLKVKVEAEKNIEKDRLLVQQSKLAAMGEMLGNIAHQWRQPLNNINLLIHFVRDNYNNKHFTKKDLDESISSAKVQIDYMSQTIDDFSDYYKPTKNKALFDIKNSIEKSAKIVATQFEVNDITLEIEDNNVEVDGFENEFQQVIVNILNNAKDAAIIKKHNVDFKAVVSVKIERQEDKAILQIINNCGEASREVLDRMFEPYFTTKFETQGTGIGLYMTKTIIETNMNGRITAQNIRDGLKFIIILPL